MSHWSSLSRTPSLVIPCAQGRGVCVSVKHRLVVVSVVLDWFYGGSQLHVFGLTDGVFVRRIGYGKGDGRIHDGKGDGKGQFHFEHGGLCISPDDDSVLVAENGNNRLQEVRIDDGSWVRFIGLGILRKPECVDCNAELIAVSEKFRVSVLSWSGSLLGRIEGLSHPLGLAISRNNAGFVVADHGNNRVCAFEANGKLAWLASGTKRGLYNPWDVVEWNNDLLVANRGANNLVAFSRHGEGPITMRDSEQHYGLTTLPDGGLVARRNWDCLVFLGLDVRCAWVCLCAAFM